MLQINQPDENVVDQEEYKTDLFVQKMRTKLLKKRLKTSLIEVRDNKENTPRTATIENMIILTKVYFVLIVLFVLGIIMKFFAGDKIFGGFTFSELFISFFWCGIFIFAVIKYFQWVYR